MHSSARQDTGESAARPSTTTSATRKTKKKKATTTTTKNKVLPEDASEDGTALTQASSSVLSKEDPKKALEKRRKRNSIKKSKVDGGPGSKAASALKPQDASEDGTALTQASSSILSKEDPEKFLEKRHKRKSPIKKGKVDGSSSAATKSARSSIADDKAQYRKSAGTAKKLSPVTSSSFVKDTKKQPSAKTPYQVGVPVEKSASDAAISIALRQSNHGHDRTQTGQRQRQHPQDEQRVSNNPMPVPAAPLHIQVSGQSTVSTLTNSSREPPSSLSRYTSKSSSKSRDNSQTLPSSQPGAYRVSGNRRDDDSDDESLDLESNRREQFYQDGPPPRRDNDSPEVLLQATLVEDKEEEEKAPPPSKSNKKRWCLAGCCCGMVLSEIKPLYLGLALLLLIGAPVAIVGGVVVSNNLSSSSSDADADEKNIEDTASPTLTPFPGLMPSAPTSSSSPPTDAPATTPPTVAPTEGPTMGPTPEPSQGQPQESQIFCLNPENENWDQHEGRAESLNGNLISLHNMTTNILAAGLARLTPGQDAWIGLQSISDNLWSDGSSLDFTNWVGTPNDSEVELCARLTLSGLTPGRWEAVDCGLSHNGIYQLPRSSLCNAHSTGLFCVDPQNLDPQNGSILTPGSGCPDPVLPGEVMCLSTEENMWENHRLNAVQVYDGNLVSIQDQDTNEIVKVLANGQGVWIGLNSLSGSFGWSDGTNLGYDNFATGQPNRNSLSCVEMGTIEAGRWDDRSCTGNRMAVYRMPAASLCLALENQLSCADSRGRHIDPTNVPCS